MERYSVNKNPAEKVNKQSKKTCDASTQTENDDDIPTQCVVGDNVKKNQNDIKHTKLGNNNDSILSTSNTDCSIAGTTTVPRCGDVINKKASIFIKQGLKNDLSNDFQSPFEEMILSRRSARLAKLSIEDEVKSVETLGDVQRAWQKEFKRLNYLDLYIDRIKSQLGCACALNDQSKPAVKRVRHVGINCNRTTILPRTTK
ncbi:hypothetical protein AGLY_004987 [Aphis glycines]|uniref:Uncharacterized protein n=1 Tax=Aphis glycines TaxID=307491 RepID=A0A6G0TVF3_APHGL|nr:hypothetical protein AGLY_004987 [Aphis glycines]